MSCPNGNALDFLVKPSCACCWPPAAVAAGPVESEVWRCIAVYRVAQCMQWLNENQQTDNAFEVEKPVDLHTRNALPYWIKCRPIAAWTSSSLHYPCITCASTQYQQSRIYLITYNWLEMI